MFGWAQEALGTASMVEYIEVEPANQQPLPGEDFCLTPRIERYVNDVQFTNVQDLKAKVAYTDTDGIIDFTISTTLTNREKETVKTNGDFKLNYLLDADKTTIKALRTGTSENGSRNGSSTYYDCLS